MASNRCSGEISTMEKQSLDQEKQEKNESSKPSKQHVAIEWAKSEWFRIYLQMARRDPRLAEKAC
jgi:hypothetical protein